MIKMVQDGCVKSTRGANDSPRGEDERGPMEN